MRCAKLLSFLMIESEKPIIVRQAIRCAKVFFFNLVDFDQLQFYDKDKIKSISKTPLEFEETCDEDHTGELDSCCQNKFIVAILKKLGHRISNP